MYRRVSFVFIFLSIVLFYPLCPVRAQMPAKSYFSEIHQNITNSIPAIVEWGDTVPMVALQPVYVYPKMHFSTKKQERYYWRLVRDVKLCLPLSKIVSSTLIETAEYLETLPEEERQKHLRKMEKDLIKEYEPVLRKMTYSQGKVLLKLIVRECDSTPYQIIQAYLGNFAANFWQGIAKMFTADLKMDYQPSERDLMIERIAVMVEQGLL